MRAECSSSRSDDIGNFAAGEELLRPDSAGIYRLQLKAMFSSQLLFHCNTEWTIGTGKRGVTNSQAIGLRRRKHAGRNREPSKNQPPISQTKHQTLHLRIPSVCCCNFLRYHFQRRVVKLEQISTVS